MANQILLKQSSVANAVPTTAELAFGELAVNTHDGLVYIKYDNGAGPVIGEVGSVTPIANTYFVQVTGDDTNNGQTWENSFRTIEKALEIATARKEDDPYAITLIDVGAGRYVSRGHLDMPDDCIIRAVHRSVILYP